MTTYPEPTSHWPATADGGLWPAVGDPAGLLSAITDWLASYANHGTRRTYAEGLGLPVTHQAIAEWLTDPAAGPEWATALRGYATILAPAQPSIPGRRPPPAPPGRLRHLHWFRWCAAEGLDPLTARPSDVKTWLNTLVAARASEATRDRLLATVSALYSYLTEYDLVAGNPAVLNRRRLGLSIRGRTSSTITLTPRQVRLLYEAAGRTRQRGWRLLGLRAQAIVALFTLGERVGELCELDDADLHTNRGRRALRVRGKGGTVRIVYLTELADRALTAYRTARDAYLATRAPAGPPAHPGTVSAVRHPLLITRDGRRMNRHDIWHILRRVAGEAGPELADLVQHLHPHALRHFYVTTGIEAGADVADVQADVGHASIDTTRGVYDHSARHPDRSAADRVAAAIQQATPAYAVGETLEGQPIHPR